MNWTISQTTQYHPDEIMKEILLKMDYKDYEVISQTDKSLVFNGSNGNIGPKSFVWYIRFRKGKFDLSDHGIQHTVTLQYQVFSTIKLIFFPVIIGFLLTIGIITKDNFAYKMAAIFIAMIITNFITLYFTAKNMLKDTLF